LWRVPASGLHLIAQAHAQVFMYVYFNPTLLVHCWFWFYGIVMQYRVDCWLGNFLDEYTLSVVTRFRWLLTCQAEEPDPIHEKTLRRKPWAMCCYALPLMINWWTYMIDFVEIQFYSNEDIEWHCMHLELNFNLVDLNSNSIQEKWDANWYRNYWKFSCDYGVEKKRPSGKTQIWNFHLSSLGNLLNRFPLETVQRMIYATKPILTNHCHSLLKWQW
jgi:hypothetical protein